MDAMQLRDEVPTQLISFSSSKGTKGYFYNSSCDRAHAPTDLLAMISCSSQRKEQPATTWNKSLAEMWVAEDDNPVFPLSASGQKLLFLTDTGKDLGIKSHSLSGPRLILQGPELAEKWLASLNRLLCGLSAWTPERQTSTFLCFTRATISI